MHVSGLEGTLWALGILGELLLLGIIFFRRLQSVFPVFTAYLVWVLVSDPILLAILYSPHYGQVFFAFSLVQFFLELFVLVEIGANVARPAKRSLPKAILLVLAGLLIVVGVVAYVYATHVNAPSLNHPRTVFVANCVMAVLRLMTFLLIAASAQLLGLGWRNYVLQLASGLAFYAAVTLVAAIAQINLRTGPGYAEQFRHLSQLGVMGYLCSLTYWCYSFARKEAPRKEFSPQMTQLLVSISGSAKRHSVAARSLDIK